MNRFVLFFAKDLVVVCIQEARDDDFVPWKPICDDDYDDNVGELFYSHPHDQVSDVVSDEYNEELTNSKKQ